MLPPNAPAVTGPAAIEAMFKTFPPITAFELRTEEVEGTGDLAYVRGRYTMTMSPPGAPAIAGGEVPGDLAEAERREPEVGADMFGPTFRFPPRRQRRRTVSRPSRRGIGA